MSEERPAIPRPEIPPLREREEKGGIFKIIAGLFMIVGLALTCYGFASLLISVCRKYGIEGLSIPVSGLTILLFGIGLFAIFKKIGMVS
ncbi:hypothetical protein DRO64_10005 [Candidatus Bathyarchaeota archaeon]|nr:MAG: hypothetical protein DRO64_10005 [Candidatus Bathyarchaeota archaeon]